MIYGGDVSEDAILKEALEQYYQGFTPIKIKAGTKAPIKKNWQNTKYKDEDAVIKEFKGFNGNLGLLLGEQPSGSYLVDIDCDTLEAVLSANLFKLDTRSHITVGTLPSHFWFGSHDEIKSAKYLDLDGTMIVELRSTGGQTLIPPSIHPSGQELSWVNQDVSCVTADELHRHVSNIASMAFIARHWPSEGSRQYFTLALTGYLVHNVDDELDIKEYMMNLLSVVEENTDERINAVESTLEKARTDVNITGGPTCESIVGKEVWDRFVKYLDLPAKQSLELDFDDEDNYDLSTDSLISVHDLMLSDINTNEEIVEGLIWRGKTHWLYSDPNAGKTMLALAIALHVASGSDFSNRIVKQGPVVIIEEDSSLAVVTSYLDNFGSIYSIPTTNLPIYFNRKQGIRIFDKRGSDRIANLIDSLSTPPVLVIYDSCERILPSSSFNSREVDPLDQLLKHFANRGIANLVLDHTTKSTMERDTSMDVLYGSRAKSAIADVMLQLTGSIKTGVLIGDFTKFRGDTPPTVDIFYRPDEGFILKDRQGSLKTEFERYVFSWFVSKPRKWIDEVSIEEGIIDSDSCNEDDYEIERRRVIRTLYSLSSRRVLRKTFDGEVMLYKLNSNGIVQ